MGNFANLVRQTKTVEVSEISFTLKKWSVGFKETLKQALMENGELDTKNNRVRMTGHKDTADNEAIAVEKILEGVKTWGLIDEDTKEPVQLNVENAALLVREYPDVAGILIAHIEGFNKGVMEDGETKNS